MKKKTIKPRTCRFVLYDESNAGKRFRNKVDEIPIKVEFTAQGISICPKGYGDATSKDGYGSPVLIEFWNGELRVAIWSDINKEDPTHTVSLEKARESNRKYCSKCGQLFECHNSDGSCVKEPYGRGT